MLFLFALLYGFMLQIPLTCGQKNGTSLVLIVDLTTQNQAAVQKLGASLEQWLGDLQTTRPGWFSNYVIVTFTSTQWLYSGSVQDIPLFTSMYNVATQQITDTAADCGRPIWGATAVAMNFRAVLPGAQLWMITAGIPNDQNNNGQSAMQSLTTSGAMLNYLYVGNATSYPCVGAIDSSNISNSTNSIVLTGGFSYYTLLNSFDQFLMKYQPTLYDTISLATNNFEGLRCVDELNPKYFQVDADTVDIYIVIYAQFPVVYVTDPMGNMFNPSVIFNDGRQRVYQVQTHSTTGMYRATILAPGACLYQIRARVEKLECSKSNANGL